VGGVSEGYGRLIQDLAQDPFALLTAGVRLRARVDAQAVGEDVDRQLADGSRTSSGMQYSRPSSRARAWAARRRAIAPRGLTPTRIASCSRVRRTMASR
jgi:hypothetical protein